MATKKKGGAAASNTASSAAAVAPQASKPDSGPTILRKITARHVLGHKIKRPEEDAPESMLYTVIGLANGIKAGSSDFGPWEAFTGSFEALNAETGERFIAGVCFLPEPAHTMLIATLKAQQEADPDASIQFAFEIGIKPADTSVGYEYTCRPLVSAVQADPLAELRAKALAGRDTKALGYSGK